MKSNFTNLDILRSMAVLSVVAAHLYGQGVAFHLWAYSTTVNELLHNLSFTGVMFFFVHTCLVLMLSMERSLGPRFARRFYIRRFFRLYPLCWVAIILVLATGLTDHPYANLQALGWKGVAVNFALAQNMMRQFPSVVGPLWSLPWEVQMYIILPLFFVVLRRFSHIFAVLALWLFSVCLAVLATQPGLPRAYHAAVFPPMFISGMVAYRLFARCSSKPLLALRKIPAIAWPFFIVSVFGLQGWLAFRHSFESPYGAAVNACICLTVAIAIPMFSEVRVRWVARPAQGIAKYSYSVYLLHVVAIVFVFRYMSELPLALKIVVCLLVVALMSFISFHTIEDPFIRIGKRLARAELVPRTGELVPVPDAEG